MSAPGPGRVAVLTNGNYFAQLVLARLLGRDDLELLVVVTTGMRRQKGSRLTEAGHLLRKWGPRYAAYKITTYGAPAVAQLLRREPRFVASTCHARGIPVVTARNVNADDVVLAVDEFAPDVLVSVSCPYRVGPRLLTLPTAGALNVHSSLLPAYAGIGTYVHVLAAGEQEAGITVHEMVDRFDAGVIVGQQPVEITPGMSVFGLFSEQCRRASGLLSDAVDATLATGRVTGAPQDETRRSYFGEPTRGTVQAARRRGHPLLRLRELSPVFARTGAA